MKISGVAVITKNRALGRDNALLFHVPGDLPRFKKITLGHPIIMGRRTFESKELNKTPLPDRMNIVVTKNLEYKADGVVVCHTIAEAIQKARERDALEIFVIGGGQIFQEAWPFIEKLYLTVIDVDAEGETYFPEYSEFSKVLFKEDHSTGGLKYAFLELEK